MGGVLYLLVIGKLGGQAAPSTSLLLERRKEAAK